MKITVEYQKNNKTQFNDIKDKECFYSNGVLYMRILQHDLDEYGIDCVNAISIIGAGLTYFHSDEKVYKAERIVKKER